MYKVYQPFFKYLRPYRGMLILATVCGIIAGLSSGIGLPFIFNNVLSRAFATSANGAAPGPVEIVLGEKPPKLAATASTLPDVSIEHVKNVGDRHKAELLALPGVTKVSIIQQAADAKPDAAKNKLLSWLPAPNVKTDAADVKFVLQVTLDNTVTAETANIPATVEDIPVVVVAAHAGLGLVLLLALAVPLMFLLRAAFGYASGVLSMRIAVEFARNIQQDVFDHLQAMPMAFFDTHQRGDLQTRLSRDTTIVQAAILDTAPELLRQPFQALSALAAIIYLSFLNHEIGFVVAFVIVAPLCLLPVRILGRKLRRRSREWTEHASTIAQHIWENFNGIHEIRSFGLEEVQKRGFEQKLRMMLGAQFKIKKYLLLQQPSMEIIVSVLVSLIFVYAWAKGISFATFTAFGMALYFAFDPIKRIGQAMNILHQAEPNVQRLREFFAIQPDIADPTQPKTLDHVRGQIAFENVQFAYGDAPVLSNVSINIPAGCNCALVGPSGAGKSTFAKLIPRFYDVRGGRVTLDGVDVRDVRQADLRRHIAVVSQHPVLFDLTLMENIRLGRAGASDAEVIAAAKRAHADDFIRGFADGYNTLAGDRGDRLSGGQKQRLALARAFLKDAPVLLLDEATSALDAESEQAIQAALADLTRNRTVLTIAHRLSTIRNSAMILVFDRGQLVAHGTHAELMKSSELYSALVSRQMDQPHSA